MKLIIQIPHVDTADRVASFVAGLPRFVPGMDEVEWLIVDDGSSPRTTEIGREMGFDHVVKLNYQRGAAAGFHSGLDACVKLGADIIVNVDDYDSAGDIPKLVAPIRSGEADIVVSAYGIDAPHETSSSRAYNREAALLEITKPI